MGKTRAPQKRRGDTPRPGHPCHPRAGPSVPSGQGMRGSAWPLPGECPAWVRAPVTTGESSDSGRALLTCRRGPVRESVDAPGLGGVREPQSPGPQELSLGQRWLPGAPPPPGATARTYQMKSVQWLQKQRTLLWWHWRDPPTMIFPVLILFSTLLCHIAIAGRTCPKPDDLPFAVVVPLKTFYEPGEQIVYSCKPGYVSRGGMRRFTCPLTGMWPINTLKCTRRVCPFAGILENGIVHYTSFEYPNTINFTCNPGFYLNGTSSSKCNEEGKWSPELPVCVPLACPPPPVPKSATLKAHKSLAGNTSLYGDTEVFECLPQHAMFGNDTITCTAHGNWTKLPECKEVKCPFPSRPDNGFVNYPAKQVLYYKDKATFGCHDTYTLDGPEEVECTKMGNWSALPSCKASCKISIKKATVLYQGMRVKIQDQFKDGMKHGDKVSFFCKNKEKKCSYTEEANCIDGTLEIPKCFKEHSSLAFWKTDAWDVKPC